MAARVVALLLVATVLVPSPGAANEPDPEGYERILIPVYGPTRPGAFGSVWQTELTIRNASNFAAQIFQSRCAYFCSGGCVFTMCFGGSETPPHSPATVHVVPSPANPANVGVFIYVNKPRASELAIQLRVRNVSRQRDSWGVEIPVVRESEMRRGVTHLLDIPLSANFRQHLRLYGSGTAFGEGDLDVQFYAGNTNTLLSQRTVRLSRDLSSSHGDYPQYPSYAEIPSIVPLFEPESVPETVRIQITPLTPELTFWAMVSVTNNETQEVTLITPQ